MLCVIRHGRNRRPRPSAQGVVIARPAPELRFTLDDSSTCPYDVRNNLFVSLLGHRRAAASHVGCHNTFLLSQGRQREMLRWGNTQSAPCGACTASRPKPSVGEVVHGQIGERHPLRVIACLCPVSELVVVYRETTALFAEITRLVGSIRRRNICLADVLHTREDAQFCSSIAKPTAQASEGGRSWSPWETR